MQTYDLADGAVLHCLSDEKQRFKTSRLTAILVLPMKQETSSSYAILPFLLNKSTQQYPSFFSLSRHLDQLYGARIFADVAKIGDAQALMLGAVCLDDEYTLNNEQVTKQCSELLCSMLFSPALENGVFNADNVKQEKRILSELIESQINDKRYYARKECTSLLCQGEGYALDEYGTIQGVSSLTPQQITHAWQQVLKTAQICFVYQGNSNINEQLANSLKDSLAKLTDRKPAKITTKIGSVEKVVKQTKTMDINQAKLVLGFKYTGDNLKQDIPALRLANTILGGSALSLLFKTVREELSLCYYCASSFDRIKGVMLIDSGVDNKNIEKTKQESLKQLELIASNKFTDQDFEYAKLSLANQFLSIIDSQSSLGAWYVAQCLDDEIITPEQAVSQLNQVTREQVSKVAANIQLGCEYVLTGNGEVMQNA